MLNKALEALKILEQHGYSCYIVGGYVRDYLLGIKSNDIDICTNATPKQIIEIFDTNNYVETGYGSVRIIYKKYGFDITTYRREIKYENNRKPIKIKYINDIAKDLIRRDFTINTLCMNSEGKIMDLLYATPDLNKKIIRTVGHPRYRLKEDSLRILRAIRFATYLDFEIDKKTKKYIIKYGYLLKKLSYNRKKEELNKIFSSKNKNKGITLLEELKLTEHLELHNLDKIKNINNLIGIWSLLEVDNIYPFTKLEKEQMPKIREIYKLNILDNYILYKYGLYLATIVADMKNISKKTINLRYSLLPISTQNDIVIKPIEISQVLKKEPGSYIKEIIKDLEIQILSSNLKNNKEDITKYIINNYK